MANDERSPKDELQEAGRDAGNPLLSIIFEDRELLVINKPAGLVCHPTKGDQFSSLISRVRLHLGESVHPHLVNRLDRETSGVTVVAKQDVAAREIRHLWESRLVQKEYAAIVHGHVQSEHGLVDAPLGKDEQSRVAIKDCVREDGLPAQTEYWVEGNFWKRPEIEAEAEQEAEARQPYSFLRVAPRTGRKHQIRIHLAHLGHPIVGDKLYGGDEELYLALVEDRLTSEQWRTLVLPHHALHAARLQFNWRGKQRIFEAEPEKWFTDWLSKAACAA